MCPSRRETARNAGGCRLPTTDTFKYLRLEADGGWHAQQAAGAAKGWAALCQRLSVLHSQCLSAAMKLPALRSRMAPCMSYRMGRWRPAKNSAKMRAARNQAANLISGSHNVMLADLDISSADAYCHMAHARQLQCAWQAAAAATTALCARSAPHSPVFDFELQLHMRSPCDGLHGIPELRSFCLLWPASKLQLRDTWCRHASMCHMQIIIMYVMHEIASTMRPPRCCADTWRARHGAWRWEPPVRRIRERGHRVGTHTQA